MNNSENQKQLMPIKLFQILYIAKILYVSIRFLLLSIFKSTIKSRAVDRSTIQFLTIFGVLLTETCYYCYVQKSMKCWVLKRLHEFSSIFVDLPWLALFLKTPFKNVLKSFDRALLLSCKCIFISKIWKNSWGSYILVGKVIYFSYQNVGSSRIPIRFFFNFYL